MTAPSLPTIQTLRGDQSRSAYQTLSGSGICGLSAPCFQPVTASEPQMIGRPGAPGRVAGQDDRLRLGAGFAGVQFAPIVHPLLEHVGVTPLHAFALSVAFGSQGWCFQGVSRVRPSFEVGARIEVDVADRPARLELERMRRPLQVAGGQHGRVRLLPGILIRLAARFGGVQVSRGEAEQQQDERDSVHGRTGGGINESPQRAARRQRQIADLSHDFIWRGGRPR